MRSQIKTLIDLIESEKWELHDGPLVRYSVINWSHFRPQNEDKEIFIYPRICWCAIQLNKDIQILLEVDEQTYLASLFKKRHDIKDNKLRILQENALNEFLINRK